MEVQGCSGTINNWHKYLDLAFLMTHFVDCGNLLELIWCDSFELLIYSYDDVYSFFLLLRLDLFKREGSCRVPLFSDFFHQFPKAFMFFHQNHSVLFLSGVVGKQIPILVTLSSRKATKYVSSPVLFVNILMHPLTGFSLPLSKHGF